jgi:drug/metabolite transporter (DMT)-like permease
MLITSHEEKRQTNLKLWVSLMLLTSLFAWVSAYFAKWAMVSEVDVPFYLFISMTIGTFISWFSYKFVHKTNWKNYKKDGILKFSLILGVMHFLSFSTFQHALSWNLAIVFTINSFSILIPIILSIIFYKEHFNMKKAFVILLSIVSVILFI